MNGEDCKGSLNCYERDNGEPVPGILIPAGFPSKTDICFDPAKMPKVHGNIVAVNIGSAKCGNGAACHEG